MGGTCSTNGLMHKNWKGEVSEGGIDRAFHRLCNCQLVKKFCTPR